MSQWPNGLITLYQDDLRILMGSLFVYVTKTTANQCEYDQNMQEQIVEVTEYIFILLQSLQ